MAGELSKQHLLQSHVKRLANNIARVHGMVSIYQKVEQSNDDVTDILRSAVVFLHASLEDFLRSLASMYLPSADADVFEAIPLVGMRRPGKFTLKQVAEHRGKSVDGLIQESVIAHLERSNFNNTSEINTLLKNLGLNPANLDEQVTELGRMMSRRHEIVHRADILHASEALNELDQDTVNTWMDAVIAFRDGVLFQIEQKEVVDE
ncbi:MAG: HEPN domain-containing protein [Planctomycetaceae bacterium]